MRSDLHLIDTSVWIGYFSPRSQSPSLQPLWDRVEALLSARAEAVTGMIRLEILGGARDERDYERLEEALSGLRVLPADETTWNHGALMAFQLRRRGRTIPFTDALIAAVALRADATLLHRDRHFDTIATHFPLRAESYA